MSEKSIKEGKKKEIIYVCMNCKNNLSKEALIYGEYALVVKCPECNNNEFKLFYKKSEKF